MSFFPFRAESLSETDITRTIVIIIIAVLIVVLIIILAVVLRERYVREVRYTF